MSRPGWYPDPAGTSGQLRYWDGQGWSQDTTADPADAPPGPPPQPGSRRAAPWMIAVAVLLIVVVIGAFVLRAVVAQRDANAEPGPASSVSAWDDSSPTETPTPTPSGSGTPTAGACPPGVAASVPPPDDGRVHGGPLSFRRLPDPWGNPYGSGRFPYSRDAAVQTQPLPEELSWEASAQVGILQMSPYPGRDKAPDALLRCIMTSDFYTSVDVRLTERRVRDVTVGSVAATQLDARLSFRHPELTATGSDLRIIVVDTDPVTYYFHAVPKERGDLIADLDDATASLRPV